jgi:hypothetical protein
MDLKRIVAMIKKHLQNLPLSCYTSLVTEKTVTGFGSPEIGGHTASSLCAGGFFVSEKRDLAPLFGRIMRGAVRLAGSYSGLPTRMIPSFLRLEAQGRGISQFFVIGAPL